MRCAFVCLNLHHDSSFAKEANRVLKEKIPSSRLVAHLSVSSLTGDGIDALRETFTAAMLSKVRVMSKNGGCTLL